MQFRQKALAKLQSPEELDIPVRLARPQGRTALAVAAIAIALAAFWSLTGTVVQRTDIAGVLTSEEGSYLLQSPYAGQITAVHAAEGELLKTGDPLLDVRTDRKTETVRMVAAGRVTELPVKIGAVVATGADLATVERIGSPADPLVAVLYAAGGSAAGIQVGAPVDLTVQSVPAQSYGTLRGRVQAIGRVPQTREQITGFLADGQLAAQFTASGEAVPVTVRLDRAGTPSGYAWSRAGGPPYAIGTTTVVSGAVRLAAQHPIDWILP